ncbi:MAG TPA: rhomboid family intramembrane serine protease [Candidatus Baltobacteraceae bacterium]|jgi:rhomboid protease GluP|nr:rhomboid family intramembrane serine protease [Candidatus Baltobacteraceae bacterium]
MSGLFGGRPQARPKICPSCGSLVGSVATKCPQCGASVNFSLAAASRSLGRLMPTTAPATYAILSVCCVIFAASFLATFSKNGGMPMQGGIEGLLNFGAIDSRVLISLGASLPQPIDWLQPWRLVTAIFLHASILHILFNMWVLMDIGPQIEELYGSARYLFVFVVSGIGGYAVSSFVGKFSVGASGSLLGLIGLLLAVSIGRRSMGMQMLRNQLLRWLIYIVVWGFFFPGIDNWAHLGGFVTGFILGKLMAERTPASPEERKRAYAMGWGAALVVVASFVMAGLSALGK